MVVSDFFVVASFLVVAAFLVVDFFVVAADSVFDVLVVIVSFLLAHEVIKPTAAKTATDVIRDFFIGVVNGRRMFSPSRDCKQFI
ncbi:MAG: hypothetical protein QOH88_977 [Verrucomicrobiota bacterium]